MRTLLLIAAMWLSGCQPDVNPVPNPDSFVAKKIVLKDISTGRPPGDREWSYFGEKRWVEYTVNTAGVVTKLKFSVGSAWDGMRLQEVLEKKLTEENGTKVAFDCRAESNRLELLNDMAVTETICTVRSGTQILTIQRVHPRYEGDAQKFPNLRMVYDATNVLLEDIKLENDRIKLENAKFEEESKQRHERADKDI